jgi:hypothetical protein
MNRSRILDFRSRLTYSQSMTSKTSSSKTCRKCGGTGRVHSPVDFGRCWACQGLAKPISPETLADDEAYRREMGLDLTFEERSAARRARRALLS